MKVLLTEQQIRDGVSRLAERITHHYRNKPLTIVGLLQDSIALLADLMRLIEVPAQMMVVQPFHAHVGPQKPGRLQIDMNSSRALRNRHVLLVDDVFDTGCTLAEMFYQVDEFEPRSIRTAVLLRKKSIHDAIMEPDYAVYNIPNEVVVGYGLDYHGKFRHLRHIAALEPSELLPIDATRCTSPLLNCPPMVDMT